MEFLKDLGLKRNVPGASTGTNWLTHKNNQKSAICSPIDGKIIAHVQKATAEEYEQVIETAGKAFAHWRCIPAPQRGDIIRKIGDRLRDSKGPLGSLISYETGKPIQEGLGEVQEIIDICDFCVGQSKRLDGVRQTDILMVGNGRTTGAPALLVRFCWLPQCVEQITRHPWRPNREHNQSWKYRRHNFTVPLFQRWT